jgi:hypothetical protein
MAYEYKILTYPASMNSEETKQFYQQTIDLVNDGWVGWVFIAKVPDEKDGSVKLLYKREMKDVKSMAMMPKSVTIKLKYEEGAWFVGSNQIPGLLCCSLTIPLALEEAAKAIRDLALAQAMEISNGNHVKPMFIDKE